MTSDVCIPSAAEVRAIITTSLTDPAIEAMIEDAELMVEACIASMTCQRKTAIIKWVTAHLISSMSSITSGGTGVITSDSLGDASRSYAKPTLDSTGLFGSTYGQQAMALDPNGCLAALGMRKTLFKVL